MATRGATTATLRRPRKARDPCGDRAAEISAGPMCVSRPIVRRLCVPALRLNNGSAGVSSGGPVQFPATALPAPIAVAATSDPVQALRYGWVEGTETVDQGRNLLEGPDINIAGVPVNGRTFEA